MSQAEVLDHEECACGCCGRPEGSVATLDRSSYAGARHCRCACGCSGGDGCTCACAAQGCSCGCG